MFSSAQIQVSSTQESDFVVSNFHAAPENGTWSNQTNGVYRDRYSNWY